MSSATVQGLHRGSPVRAGERGRLVVAKQVVEKIAAQARADADKFASR